MTHDEAVDFALEILKDGLEELRTAAELLRSPAVHSDPRAMRIEIALTRAIDSLELTKGK